MKVDIKQGTIEGLKLKTQVSNKPYIGFLGIPYAKAPVNDLRFKPPVEHPGWSGVLEAFSEGSVCVQFDLMTNRIVGSEDCLYLNVFVPQETRHEKLAVMVFIHGGIFYFGSASTDEYTPEYLLEQNVIVVTINYRLHALGFLNLEVDECSGNMGLKDQMFAIKWVKSNISAFGGDADNVTIFGESAGSASVHFHLISPQTQGLFQKAIMQSGCVFNPWAFNEKHKEAASKFVKNLGCSDISDPREMIQYLQNVSASDLVKATKVEVEEMDFPFVPSVECDSVRDRFLPAHPAELIKTAFQVPSIAGVNNMEGYIIFKEDILKYFDDFYKTDKFKKPFQSKKYTEEIIDSIKTFYTEGVDLECEATRLESICNLHSDLFFIKDFHRGFDCVLKESDTPVYTYVFKFDGEINARKNMIFGKMPALRKALKGASHVDELSYLFYGKSMKLVPKADSPEYEMCKTMSKLWTNFAKTGNPNSTDLSFTWNKTSADNPKYLSLDGDKTCMVDELLFGTRVKFWESISEKVRPEEKQ